MKRWLALGLLWPALATAHPLAPALLELRASGAEDYEVRWRTSVARVRGVEVAPVLPRNCRAVTPPRTVLQDGEAMQTAWSARCAGGLEGNEVAVAGLEGSGINVVLRVAAADGATLAAILDARQPVFTVPAPSGALPRALRYGALGVEHLLTGLDHLLFVLGLLAVVHGRRALVVAITAFTAGHSLTLAAAALGFVRVNPAVTELGIAASLVAVALAMLRPRTAPGLLARRPGLLTLGFGLLHGLGFAGAMNGVGLPQAELVPALLAFNLGIEAGQLAVVGAALAAARLGRALAEGDWSQRVISRLAPAYIIGSLAGCWCIERAVALLA
jgi:hypothetical protein